MPSPNKEKVNDSSSFSYTPQIGEGVMLQENKVLRSTISDLRDEVQRFRTPSLMIAEVFETHGEQAVIKIPNGNKFLVNVSRMVSDISCGDSVAVEQRNLTVVKKLESVKNFDVEKFVIFKKPSQKWNDVGGLDEQIRKVREIIELPLTSPELFKKVGIEPPKGLLLYGPPGTGKTLVAKAVANATNASFIEIVGSELVQKFIGEGAKLVKEIFDMARARAPSIIFIDEIDALASRRIEIGTSGEREVQRTFMQLLAEIDGFKSLDNVKVIGCTNRKDILDPAILRPGRLDRLIEVPAPDMDGVKQIFKIHTKNMNISKVNVDEVCKNFKGMTGAEIKAIITEAGYNAIRTNRSKVKHEDFLDAFKQSTYIEGDEGFSSMFG